MSTGLPVLATDVGGNRELVESGRTGRLLASGDVDGLAQAMVELAADPAHAAALGLAGRARVEAQFSLPAMVSAYQDLYDQLLARH